MPRVRPVLAPLLFVAFAAFLFPAAAHGTCYKPLCCTYPPVQGTTHIESVSPQVALPGVTPVYIQGYCFGDSQGNGSITLNGEPMTDIVFWTDSEIEFIPLLDATSGNLVVTSSIYGSDSTALQANCPSSPAGYTPDYCGNDKINATFTIAPVNAPPYSPPNMEGTESAPQYVQGTWYYNDGFWTMTLTLTQHVQNSNGTWPVTGTEVTSLSPGQSYDLSGTLDQYGDLALYLPVADSNGHCIEWLVLGSGDVTSQGLQAAVSCSPSTPPVPTPYFLDGGMDSAEGPYYGFGVPPLFKSATDIPLGESVVSHGWVIGSPTLGDFGRNFPLPDGFVGFAGRFVYEQSGGTSTDGCWYDGSGHPLVTSTLGGGGWFVDPSGSWGDDGIGMDSQWDTDYQNHYKPSGQCEITTPQDLWIDRRTGPVKYITDTQMPAKITPTDLTVGLQPGSGQMVTVCEPYPKLKGKCK